MAINSVSLCPEFFIIKIDTLIKILKIPIS